MKVIGRDDSTCCSLENGVLLKDLSRWQHHNLFYFYLIILVFSYSNSFAQENSLLAVKGGSLAFMNPNQIITDSLDNSNTAAQDSLPPMDKPRLLPKRLSFGEKFLWGEHGLVRTLGIEPPLSPQERMSEIRLRRTMLTAHQIGGFTTLALMLTADYFGQLTIDGDRKAGDINQTIIAATIISYSATGLLAVLSPPPLIRRGEGGTVALHKTLAWIHLIGMIVTPILGSTIRHHRLFNMDQAHSHQVAGYLTTAVLATSMLVIVF